MSDDGDLETLHRSRRDLRALAANLIASQDAERRRIARQLHDDICQKLAVLEIDVARLQAASGAPPGLSEVRAAITSLSDDVRRLFHSLHPSAIDDLGLTAALRALAADFGEQNGIDVSFSARDVPPRLSPDVALTLYRIAQQALQGVSDNTSRPAVSLALTGSPTSLCLKIANSGVGIDIDAPSLIAMEERARMINAELRVEPAPAGGAYITVEAPLRREYRAHLPHGCL